MVQTFLSSNISLSSGDYHCRLSPSRRPESEWILSICLESSFLSLNFDSQYGQETWPSVDIQGCYVCPLHLSWSLWIISYLQWRVLASKENLRNYIAYGLLAMNSSFLFSKLRSSSVSIIHSTKWSSSLWYFVRCFLRFSLSICCLHTPHIKWNYFR